MALTWEIELCAIIGAFIGIMVWTGGKYYQKKKELGMEDVDIFFDKKFLKTMAAAGIISAVTVGSAYPQILANVNPLGSYLSTIVSSAVFAVVLNMGGNALMAPSEITLKAKRKALADYSDQIFKISFDDAMYEKRKNEEIEKNRMAAEKDYGQCHCPPCENGRITESADKELIGDEDKIS